MPKKYIEIINGPNLNMLGTREPGIYGSQTLEDIENSCVKAAEEEGFGCKFMQNNSEGAIVSYIQQINQNCAGIIINAAAYTHTSVAIRDALLTASAPIIELHISNVFKREEFRHHSFISDIATGVICGLGPKGYILAVKALCGLKETKKST